MRPLTESSSTRSKLRQRKIQLIAFPDNLRARLRVANDTDLVLSSAVITRDRERGVRFARGIQTGMIHVNDMGTNDDANTAFGGEKMSGIGRFNGRWPLAEFTTEHWVSVQHERRVYSL